MFFETMTTGQWTNFWLALVVLNLFYVFKELKTITSLLRLSSSREKPDQ